MYDGTFSTAPDLPPISFEDMRNLVLEMTKEPMLKEVRCDRRAWRRIRDHFQDEWLENQKRFGIAPVEPPVNVFNRGVPVFIDPTFKRGQWKALDTKGNVMSEGFL